MTTIVCASSVITSLIPILFGDVLALDDEVASPMPQETAPEENKPNEDADDEPIPSAPPFSPRIYPILPENSSDILSSPQVEEGTTPTSGPCPASHSDFNMQRVHTYFFNSPLFLPTQEVALPHIRSYIVH